MKAHLHPLQNRGMSRDLSVSKAENTFAWENFNVRITAEGDDTLLSITNERGTRAMESQNLSGTIIGWSTLNNKLVVFTHSGTTDRIYRIIRDSSYPDEYNCVPIADGNFGFSTEHPIEAIMSYESESVQKIYWVDGINVLRSCNIMHEYGTVTDSTIFDSTRGVVLASGQTQISASIVKDNGGSTRPNGVMQYFVTAFNKNGVETGAIYVSPLVYLSPLDRGGAADGTNSNRITIEFSNAYNIGFDYLRIYGLLRTSYNGTTTAYIIQEVKVPIPTTDVPTPKVVVIDTGASYLGTVDSSALLYLGSKTVAASTLTQKDNTLFLGNLNIPTNNYTNLENWARSCRNEDTGMSSIVSFSLSDDFSLAPATDTYPYNNQLTTPGTRFKIFKAFEKYRFAVVFHKSNGDSSKAFWIGDAECPAYPVENIQYNVPEVSYNVPSVSLSSTVVGYAKALGYEYAQLCMAKATYADRAIKAQGFLNPTVYNLYDRYHDQPYARPSWNARPALGNVEFMHMKSLRNSNTKQGELQSNNWTTNRPRSYYSISNNTINRYVPEPWQSKPEEPEYCVGYDALLIQMYWTFNSGHSKFQGYIEMARGTVGSGTFPTDPSDVTWESESPRSIIISDTDLSWEAFKGKIMSVCQDDSVLHKYYQPTDALLETYKTNLPSGGQRNENVPPTGSLIQIGSTIDSALSSSELFCKYSRNYYFVDTNVVTFHSPELEYEQVNLDKNTKLRLRIIGAARITGSVTDVDLQVADADYVGSNLAATDYSTANIANSVGTLTASPLYYDSLVEESGDNYYLLPNKGYYMTYLWHKIGSMINCTDAQGKVYSRLVSKRMANMQFSYSSHYVTSLSNGVTFGGISDSDNSLQKLKDIRHITGYSKGVYEVNTYGGKKLYGVDLEDTVVMPPDYKYPIYTTQSPSTTYDGSMALTSQTVSGDAIQIAYNTRPHAVIALPGSQTPSTVSSMYILPYRSGSDGNDQFTLDETFVNNFFACNASAYLQITTEMRSALLGNGLRVEGTGYVLNQVRIISGGNEYSLAQGTEFNPSNGVIQPNSSHTQYVTTSASLYISFVVTGMAMGGVWFYNGNTTTPVNIYGSSAYLHVGWLDDVTIDDSNIHQGSITLPSGVIPASSPYLLLAELYETYATTADDKRYGGITESAVQNNTFIPCSDRKYIGNVSSVTLRATEGDTYFQRYDCLMSYPQSENDANQVIDIASVMLETHINLDGRTDKDRGVAKLAAIDYTNFGIINPVYNQENNFLQYMDYDDSLSQTKLPTTVTWSEEKHDLATTDEWMHVTLASTISLDSAFGPLNALRRFNNTILAFQDKSISEIIFNPRVQISTSDGVPIELSNSKKVEGKRTISNHYGCLNKWSIVEGKSGLYFKDDLSKVIAVFNGQAIDALSSKAKLDAWVKSKAAPSPWSPSTWNNTVAFYDNISSDVYFVNKATVTSGNTTTDAPYPCLVYNEQIGNFVGFFSYGSIPVITDLDDRLLAVTGGVANNAIWAMKEGFYNKFFGSYKPSYVIWRVAPEAYTDKIWSNLEYRADFMQVLDSSGKDVYTEGESPTGYGAASPGEYRPNITFDTVRIWNEYQDTGNITMTWMGSTSAENSNGPDVRKKFRIWRADIPRDVHENLGLNRIRNPWIWLKIRKDFSATGNLDQMRFQLHDMVVKYFTTD